MVLVYSLLKLRHDLFVNEFACRHTHILGTRMLQYDPKCYRKISFGEYVSSRFAFMLFHTLTYNTINFYARIISNFMSIKNDDNCHLTIMNSRPQRFLSTRSMSTSAYSTDYRRLEAHGFFTY